MIDKEMVITERTKLVRLLNEMRNVYRIQKDEISKTKEQIHELKLKLNTLDMSLIGK